MNGHPIEFAQESFVARGSGALWWPARGLLVVSDLHLGKAARRARSGAGLLPPYETSDTLRRLGQEIDALSPRGVLCLGDSFDDPASAGALSPEDAARLAMLQHGRDWLWIEGNHDRNLAAPGGKTLPELRLGPIWLRHIAEDFAEDAAEISGHYHPKAGLTLRGAFLSRPCFLHDGRRLILPAFGTYTGGLDWRSEEFARLLRPEAVAVLTGPRPLALALPRRAQSPAQP